MYGYHITLVLNALLDEELMPCYVTYLSVVLLAAAQSGREHDDVVRASKGLLYHQGEISILLFARLLHRHTQGSQPLEMHQEVTHQVLDSALVVLAYHISQCDTVDGTQGMVAHHYAWRFAGRQILLSLHVYSHS